MRFRDFLAKKLLEDTDWLVGYDSVGNYIRIPKSVIAASVGSQGGAGGTLAVQYSANGDSWHDTYTTGDCWIRIKNGSGAWSGAIRITVSAYDIWKAQGNIGSEADFLASLKGDPGDPADLSGLRLQDINGYTELLQQVSTAITNAKEIIIQEVVETAIEKVMAQFKELNLDAIKEIKSLSEDDFIPVVTEEGLRKVRVKNLSDNVAVRVVGTQAIATSVSSQLKTLTIRGAQDGENAEYVVSESYVPGTSLLFLNGQRLTPGQDYEKTASGFVLLEHNPSANEMMIFNAVVKQYTTERE